MHEQNPTSKNPEAGKTAIELQRERSREAAREQYQKINWSEYHSVLGDDSSALRFYAKNDDERHQIVRMYCPEFDTPVIVRIPEMPANEKMQERITQWEHIQEQVMLDETTLWVLGEIGVRYNRRQPMTLEGPPAVSKTFATWVFSAIIGQPYYRLSFSAGTKESNIIGSRVSDQKEIILPTVMRLLKSAGVSRQVEWRKKLIADGKEDKLTSADRDLIIVYDNLIELLESKALDDEEVLDAAKALMSQINLELLIKSEYTWKDSPAVEIIEWGGILALDEPNTVDNTSVLEVLLPLLEVNTVSFSVSGFRPPVVRSPDAFIVMAQNPPAVSGRSYLSDAWQSRNETVVLPNVTPEYVENILKFKMVGDDPDVRVNGKLIKGRRGVETPQKSYFESLPADKVNVVCKSIATLHVSLSEMVSKGLIGRTKKNGGSYVFDQRDVSALVDAMIAGINRTAEETPNGGLEEPAEINWGNVVREALREVYLSGVFGDEKTPSDYKIVYDYIDSMPLWNMLKPKNQAGHNYMGPGASAKVSGNEVVPEW